MARPSNEQSFSISETAKMINFPGGEHKFFEWLRKNRFLLMDNTPSQVYRDREWLIIVKKHLIKDDSITIIPTTRVTIKGLAGLEKIVKKCFPICKPCKDGK
jgi:phage antirepressor YoqD-like protein